MQINKHNDAVLYEGELPVPKDWRDEFTGEAIAVQYRMDLDDLIEVEGIEGMNDYLDAVSGVVLSDIAYEIVERSDDGTLIIQATGVVEDF